MAKFDLSGKTIVITGASGGIGASAAVAFAKKGANLVLSARKIDVLNKVADQVRAAGSEAYVVPADVTKMDEMQKLADKAIGLTGRLDVMLLGAGFAVLGRAEKIPLELLRQQMEVNFWGVIHGFYAAIPQFRKQGSGQFIILNSIMGRMANPWSSAYCASKFALWGWADSVRAELKKKNIDIISIYPGFVKTRFQARTISPDFIIPEDLADKMRGVSPEKIAETIVRASEKRKGEVICTVSGNLGARLLPASYYIGEFIRQGSMKIQRRMFKSKKS